MVGSESRLLDLINSTFYPARLHEGDVEVLVRANRDLSMEFLRSVYAEFKNNPTASTQLHGFLRRVTVSEHSLDEWLHQVVLVYRWLAKHGRTAKFVDVSEYASCAWCGDATNGVLGYLDSCGFERSWQVVGETLMDG